MLSHSVVSNTLLQHSTQPVKFLCPWNFTGKNTGKGCHFLPQGIFLTWGLNLCLLHFLFGRQILYYCATWEVLKPNWNNHNFGYTFKNYTCLHPGLSDTTYGYHIPLLMQFFIKLAKWVTLFKILDNFQLQNYSIRTWRNLRLNESPELLSSHTCRLVSAFPHMSVIN